MMFYYTEYYTPISKDIPVFLSSFYKKLLKWNASTVPTITYSGKFRLLEVQPIKKEEC